MECPSCQTSNPAGQKFCGSCGHKLEAACPRCRTTNPPYYKFCGQCGASLTEIGAITLARSGLITQVNQKALDMLGLQHSHTQGKPFSLFVERADLVIFFSHLNELLSSAKKQSFEINLKHKGKNHLHVLLECRVEHPPPQAIDVIHIALTEITDSRLAAAQLQTQQDLLSLIFSVASNISTVNKKHLEHSIADALKKICLFTKTDICFICGINRAFNRLEVLYEWRQPSTAPSKKANEPRGVPLPKIKRTIIKLRQEKLLVVPDLAKLEPSEREEMLFWHQVEIRSVVCYLIYSGKIPIGVIGVAKASTTDEWAPNCVSLVKFFGDFIADRLPSSTRHRKLDEKLRPARAAFEKPESGSLANAPGEVIHITEKQSSPGEKSKKASTRTIDRPLTQNWPALPDMTRPMLLQKFSGPQIKDRQPVFPRDDGLVLLTCPGCGMQESVSVGQFDKLGNAIRVICPCGKQFAAVLEKRRFFRKSVRLEGYFSLGGDLGPIAANGSIWGPMVVQDLSKAGLRFSSKNANLVHPDDLLMVRFNLDNTNQALIHKTARVISVTRHGVGCRFEGADSYDITLGFYFM